MAFSGSFDTQIHDALASIFPEDFVDGIYYPGSGFPGTPVRVFVDRDIARFPGVLESQVNERRPEIELLRSEVEDPTEDALVTIEGVTYRLVDRISQDSYYSRWAIARSEL